ncbi:MAG TPA: methionyl-tRNA formyltransferase [Povalibacter sp.]
MKSLSLIFAGTPEFAVPALEALVASRHRIVAVYTQPDRPAGRGQHLAASAVKQCALRHGLTVEQPVTLRDPAAVERLAQWNADAMIVVAYGLILPAAVLAVPPLGCVNIHGSLLPRWRGAAPIHRALLAGDAQTGVTIMQMDAGLDTGPMLLERATPLTSSDTSASVHDRLAAIGADALMEALDGLIDGSLVARPQPENGATYAAKIRKDEALLDWRKTAHELDRQVRAFNPWPVAETRWNGQQLRIWQAQPLDTEADAAPGSVLADTSGICVATGEGVLCLTRVQLAGRKAVSAVEFLNAHRLDGAVFA